MNTELKQIANGIMQESENEICETAAIVEAFKMIEGKEPKTTYVTGCNCAGDYCNTPFLHGIRLDGLSIKESKEKWKSIQKGKV